MTTEQLKELIEKLREEKANIDHAAADTAIAIGNSYKQLRTVRERISRLQPLLDDLSRQVQALTRQKQVLVLYVNQGKNECVFKPSSSPDSVSHIYPSQLEALTVAMFAGFTRAQVYGKEYQRWVTLNNNVTSKLSDEKINQCRLWANQWLEGRKTA